MPFLLAMKGTLVVSPMLLKSNRNHWNSFSVPELYSPQTSTTKMSKNVNSIESSNKRNHNALYRSQQQEESDGDHSSSSAINNRQLPTLNGPLCFVLILKCNA